MLENLIEFKFKCRVFLNDFALGSLRTYARSIGVSNPTKDKKKNVLIEEIIAVLTEEMIPQSPSSRGAPVKSAFIDPKIVEGIKKIRKEHIKAGSAEDIRELFQEVEDNPFLLTLAEEDEEEKRDRYENVEGIHFGQMETVNGVAVLLCVGQSTANLKIVVGDDLVREHDLRDGDVITCRVKTRQNLLEASEILDVNGIDITRFKRKDFDLGRICYPYQKIAFCSRDGVNTVVAKMLEWLVVIAKGQRGLIVAPPKTGKTHLLTEMARTASRCDKNVVVISLLVDQPPEAIALYKDLTKCNNVLYTTYDESPERQMFVTECALKRARAYAESGKDVLLLVDSFNAISRAFNETDESLGGKTLACGLESKTVQYLKRYFGTAKCVDGVGSLTIIGALSINTGNPADDLLRAELAPVANMEIVLSEDLAKRRIYPPLDLLETKGKRTSMASGIYEEYTNDLIRNEYLSQYTIEDLHDVIAESKNFKEMETKIFRQLKKKEK